MDVAEIPERVRELRAALAEARIELEVRAGAELSWDDVPALGAAELETAAQGPPGRRWLLLEAPLPGTGTLGGLQDSAQRAARSRLSACSSAIPSARRARRAPGAVERLLAAGDRLQVNGSSLTGYHGAARARRGARARRRRPRRGHRLRRPSPSERAPSLTAAVAVLRRHGTPAAQAEALAAAAPRALLEDGLAPPRRLAA